MSDDFKKIARVAAALFTGGTSELLLAGKKAMEPPGVKSAAEIEQEAQKESRRRARKRAEDVATKGKTIFTSPQGVGGMNLKDKFGM